MTGYNPLEFASLNNTEEAPTSPVSEVPANSPRSLPQHSAAAFPEAPRAENPHALAVVIAAEHMGPCDPRVFTSSLPISPYDSETVTP